MSKAAELSTPWRPITTCAIVALAIPALYYGQLYGTARRVWLTPSLHPEIGGFSKSYENLMKNVLLRAFVGEILVSFSLAILPCWIIHVRRTMSKRKIGSRAMTDVGLVLAFLLAPWFVPAVGFLRLPRGSPLDGWIQGNLWLAVMPCLTAASAGVTFFFWSRRYEQVGKVA